MAEITINNNDSQKLLNALFNSDYPFLELSLDEEEGLVVGDNASTWLGFNRSKDETPDKITLIMKDDDGVCELEYFKPSTEGLKELLVRHSETQDQFGDEEYNEFLTKFLSNLKEEDIKPIPKKVIKVFKQINKQLVGKELLEKLDSIKAGGYEPTKSDMARACGYFAQSDDGSIQLQMTDFFSALIEAKGFSLEE